MNLRLHLYRNGMFHETPDCRKFPNVRDLSSHVYILFIYNIHQMLLIFSSNQSCGKMFSNPWYPNGIPSITTRVSDSSLSIRCFNSHVLHKVISGHPFGTATRIGHGDEEGRQQNAWQVSKNKKQHGFPKVDTNKQIGSDVIDVCWNCWDCCDVLSFFWGGGGRGVCGNLMLIDVLLLV